ncbi:MAG: DUF2274 domain-containing protein [Sphingomonadales bacterium]|nr:MAG: DUF2274 domain-containing protein [Sphingomonadales bacterium]
MANIKLPRLPDRTPIKIVIAVMPDLNERLTAYAAAYAQAYGVQEAVADLIPAMLTAFLDSDRAFARGNH